MIHDISTRAGEEAQSLLNFISPVYRLDDDDRPKQFGTVTLMKIGNRHFLVTAAHVLDDSSASTLYVAGNRTGTLGVLEGPSFRSALVEGSRRKDRMDIGVVEANAHLVEQIGSNSFLPMDMCDVDDIGTPGSHYIAMGYPASKNQKVRKGKLVRSPISYAAKILPKDQLANAGVIDGSHILLSFDKKKCYDNSGRIITAPDPYGISGGPLWRFADQQNQKMTSRLVGILIEWRTALKGMLAVRLPILLAAFAHKYPDLRDFIPRALTVDVTITETKQA